MLVENRQWVGLEFNKERADALMILMWGQASPVGTASAQVSIDADRKELDSFIGKRFRITYDFELTED